MSLEQQIALLIASANSLTGEVSGKMASISAAVTTMQADAHTRTLYLSPTGNDNNDGSLAAPLLTVGKALQMQAAGRLNLVLTGTTLANPFVFSQGWLKLNGRDVHIYFSDVAASQYGRVALNGWTWWGGHGKLTLHSYFGGAGKGGTVEFSQNATIVYDELDTSLSIGADPYELRIALPNGVVLNAISVAHNNPKPVNVSIAHASFYQSSDPVVNTASSGTFRISQPGGVIGAVIYTPSYFTAPTGFDLTGGASVTATPLVANRVWLLTSN